MDWHITWLSRQSIYKRFTGNKKQRSGTKNFFFKKVPVRVQVVFKFNNMCWKKQICFQFSTCPETSVTLHYLLYWYHCSNFSSPPPRAPDTPFFILVFHCTDTHMYVFPLVLDLSVVHNKEFFIQYPDKSSSFSLSHPVRSYRRNISFHKKLYDDQVQIFSRLIVHTLITHSEWNGCRRNRRRQNDRYGHTCGDKRLGQTTTSGRLFRSHLLLGFHVSLSQWHDFWYYCDRTTVITFLRSSNTSVFMFFLKKGHTGIVSRFRCW